MYVHVPFMNAQYDIDIMLGLLTLGSCTEGVITVVALCVWPCVCLLSRWQLQTWFLCPKCGIIHFLVGFEELCCVDFAESILFRRYGVVCLARWSAIRLSSTDIPTILATTTNEVVCELLAKSGDYNNFPQLFWLQSLIAFCWLINHDISIWFSSH